MNGNIETLVTELQKRFPELLEYMHLDDDLMPYLMAGYLVDWLRDICTGEYDEILLQRVMSFWQWADAQPRGTSADDDIYTIVGIAFFEALFFYRNLWWIIPHLESPEDLIDEYMIQWVGKENFEEAKRYFKDIKGAAGYRGKGPSTNNMCKLT